MVGFWGDRFRGYFADFCLPSLLSPGNLGALSAADGHRFLVCTTADDWRKLEASPHWRLLGRHATPTLIEVGLPDGPSNETKFKHMTLGHRLLVNVALRDRALASQIMPDAMYTDGTIASALRHASQGAHAVLTVAMRLKEEGLFEGLRKRRLLPERGNEEAAFRPITLKSRVVVDLAVENLYDDSVLHDWDGQHFPLWPAYSFWRAPQNTGILIQSAYYAYILLDMATIERHNERSFDIACIENYWLSDNFPDPSRIRVIGDLDEAMIVSWTPSAIYTRPPTASWLFRIPGLSAFWKGYRLRCMREFHAGIGDTQKANNIRYPIHWHSGEIDESWKIVEARTRTIMIWFFGDLFKEFSGRTAVERLMLGLWWPILRVLILLGPLRLSIRQTIKRLLGSDGLAACDAKRSEGK